MKEDHSNFAPNLGTMSAVDKHTFSTSLFLIACQICSEVARTHPGELFDIQDSAHTLLLSNWDCEFNLDKRLFPDRVPPGFANARRIELLTSIITSSKGKSSPTPSVERLFVKMIRQVTMTLTEDPCVPTQEVQAMASSLALLRTSRSIMTGDALAYLKPHIGFLVNDILKNVDAQASAMPMNTQGKGYREQELQLKVSWLRWRRGDNEGRLSCISSLTCRTLRWRLCC
jgi:hypothetical protein